VLQAPSRVAATITPHHLMLDRNAIFSGGIDPHLYCLPVLKRNAHREALLWAATSGNPRFFLGTDSAPHPQRAKECANGCAGIFSAHAAIELYAEVFEDAGAIDRLEGFASHHGADFYGRARNEGEIVLVREEWTVPTTYAFGDDEVVPLRAGETIRWQVANRTIPG
jgi:dihydroorotase